MVGNETALTAAETRAAEVMKTGGPLARTWLGLHAGFSLALRPSDTVQVFRLVIALDYGRLGLLRDRMLASAEGRALCNARAAIDSRSVDYAWLRTLPADSLGGAYARALERADLDPDFFVPPKHLDPDLAYVAQRVRQTHDIWHALTGLATDIPGEIALQAFTYGQLQSKTSHAIATGGTAIYGWRWPRLFREIRVWSRAGRQAAFLLTVPWEQLWQEPLSELRARFGIEIPSNAAAVA